MSLKKRERLVAEAYNIAIFCSSTEPHSIMISNGIARAAKTLQDLNPTFDKAAFMEAATTPFPP